MAWLDSETLTQSRKAAKKRPKERASQLFGVAVEDN
jgi:hypothetical protein